MEREVRRVRYLDGLDRRQPTVIGVHLEYIDAPGLALMGTSRRSSRKGVGAHIHKPNLRARAASRWNRTGPQRRYGAQRPPWLQPRPARATSRDETGLSSHSALPRFRLTVNHN